MKPSKPETKTCASMTTSRGYPKSPTNKADITRAESIPQIKTTMLE